MINQLFLDELGNVIKYHRNTSGLNRVELAKLAGVGKTVIFDLEHGKISVRLDTLCKILDVLNIVLDLNSPLMVSYKQQIRT